MQGILCMEKAIDSSCSGEDKALGRERALSMMQLDVSRRSVSLLHVTKWFQAG